MDIETFQIDKKIKPVFRETFTGVAPVVKDENGALRPNPYLIHTTPFFLTLDESAGNSFVTVPANQSVRRTMTLGPAGIVDIQKFTAVSTSPELLVSIYDSEHNQSIMNRGIHYSNLMGTAIDPFILPVPLIFHQSQSLIFDLTDLSGIDNVFEPVLHGRRYYFDAMKEIYNKASVATQLSRPYFYTTEDAVQLQIGSSIQVAYFTVISNADFYLYYVNTHSDGDYRIKVTNLSTGLAWQNGWMKAANFAGKARDYAKLEPMLLQRNTQMKLEFINLDGGLNDVYLAFIGEHIYYPR